MQTIGNYFPFIQEDLKNLCCLATTVGATRYLCSAKRRCIVYVVMFCASRDHESWQGVASLRDATRKGVEQLTRKSLSILYSRMLPII